MKLKSTVLLGSFILLLSGCTSAEVDMVKNGSLPNCSNHTVEEMVDGYFDSPSWESGTGDDGMKFVNASGDIDLAGKEVTAMLQIAIGEDNKSFQYSEFELNELPQGRFIGNAFLKKMCTLATSSSEQGEKLRMYQGIRNLDTGEQAYFFDFQKYTTDVSKLHATKMLEIADVSIEVNGDVFVITAQSKAFPSIKMVYHT